MDAPYPAEWAHVMVGCETVVGDYGAGGDEVEIPIETVAPTPTATAEVTPLPTPSYEAAPTPTPPGSVTP